jgi:hypothetical protein
VKHLWHVLCTPAPVEDVPLETTLAYRSTRGDIKEGTAVKDAWSGYLH